MRENSFPTESHVATRDHVMKIAKDDSRAQKCRRNTRAHPYAAVFWRVHTHAILNLPSHESLATTHFSLSGQATNVCLVNTNYRFPLVQNCLDYLEENDLASWEDSFSHMRITIPTILSLTIHLSRWARCSRRTPFFSLFSPSHTFRVSYHANRCIVSRFCMTSSRTL